VPQADPAGLAAQLNALANGASLDTIRANVAASPDAAGKIGGLFTDVFNLPPSPTDVTNIQNILAGGASLTDVRYNLATSTTGTDIVSNLYKSATGLAPSQDNVDFAQTLLALGVPLTDVRTVATGAANAGPGQTSPDGTPLPSPDHSMVFSFLNELWNSTIKPISSDAYNFIAKVITDPVGAAKDASDIIAGISPVSAELSTLVGKGSTAAAALVTGIIGGIKAVGETAPYDSRTLQGERQQIANIVHQRNLGTDPATQTFRPQEAATATRLEQALGRPLSRYTKGTTADWVDAYGTTFDGLGPVLPKNFNLQNFNQQIAGHLNKKGPDRIFIDMTDAPVDQVKL
jgi:hypothetical protein